MRHPSHDQAAIRGLKEIDEDLAGLFVEGRRLCNEGDRPGIAYLIAHAGRELTNCLMRELATGGRSLEAPDASEEAQRSTIGSALGLSPNHDLVRRWFQVHNTFQGAAHARVPAPKPGPQRQAFAELADLIFGLVGGYFETQREIDVLAATADPATVPPDQLRTLLVRPVQRRRFFSRIDRVEWIPPLMTAGFFRNPPGRITFEDGSWRGRDWPEGGYLVRMAPHDPAAVVEILRGVPDNNDNFIVWRTIADAVAALPAQHGALLARKLARSMRLEFSQLFAHSTIQAAKALAQSGEMRAFELFQGLLTLAQPPQLPLGDIQKLRETRASLFWSDKWLLRAIDDYELEELLKFIPLLEAIDADLTLRVLMRQLDAATKLFVRAESDVAQAIRDARRAVAEISNAGEVGSQLSAEGEENELWAWEDIETEVEIDSRRWVRSLGHVDHMDGVRQRLAVATYESAERQVAAGVPLVRVIERLESRDNEIFRRMVLALMANAERLGAELQARLDEFITGADAIVPSFGASESAALLRTHFGAASAEARRLFAAAVEQGPGADYFAGDSTEDERRESLLNWQRRRIRWFHDRIPQELATIAERLGVEPARPTAREQALDETGSWFGGVHSVSHRSPASAEELLAMEPREMVRYLSEWKPTAPDGHPFEAPSGEGLVVEVASIAAQQPDTVKDVLPAIVEHSLPLEYLTAILHGMRSALQGGLRVDGKTAITLAEHSWRRAEEDPTETKTEEKRAIWCANAVCDTLRELTDRKPSAGIRAALWRCLERFAQSEFPWRDVGDDAGEPRRLTGRQRTPRTRHSAPALWRQSWRSLGLTSWPSMAG